MKEVTIKTHRRKTKSGKTVTVKDYTRRVGRKGQHSPKREKDADFSVSAGAGEELKNKKAEKKTEKPKEEPRYKHPKMTDEEIRRWDAAARKNSNTSFARAKQLEERKNKPRSTKKSSSHAQTVKNPLSEKGISQIFNRVEDKVAKFVEKYSGKKYKKMVK